MASVHLKNKNSPYYHAYFQVWDADAAKWKQTSKSTGLADKAKAQAVADRYEKVARAAGPGAEVTDMDLRRQVFGTVRGILEVSGRDGFAKWKGFADDWLAMRTKRVAASSARSYGSHLNNFEAWLGDGAADLLAAEIGLEMAEAYYNWLVDGGMAVSTAKKNIGTLSAVMDRAVAMWQAEQNPFPHVERRRGVANERDPFSLEEVDRLIANCDNGKRTAEHARDWHTMIVIGLCTGMRIGDAAKVRFEMFSGEGSEMVLAFFPEKTKRSVKVPVMARLADRLAELPFDEGWVCPSLAATKVGAHYGLSAQFLKLLKQAKIEMTVIKKEGRGNLFRSKTFHSLRHTLNSLLFNAGVPDEWRMKMLDHESVEVNRGYSHADVSTMREMMGRVGSALN